MSLKDDPGTLSFTGHVVGASPEEAVEYALELAFLHPVNAKDSKISVGPREVVVMVMKTEEVRRAQAGSGVPSLGLRVSYKVEGLFRVTGWGFRV